MRLLRWLWLHWLDVPGGVLYAGAVVALYFAFLVLALFDRDGDK